MPGAGPNAGPNAVRGHGRGHGQGHGDRVLFRNTLIGLAAIGLAGLRVAPAAAATTATSTAAGERLFAAQCAVCHATQPGLHKEGPSLAGVYGRRAGSASAFAGYRALKGSDVVWTEATLDAWLADPRASSGGRDTAMTVRLNDPAERAAVIAYLKTLR